MSSRETLLFFCAFIPSSVGSAGVVACPSPGVSSTFPGMRLCTRKRSVALVCVVICCVLVRVVISKCLFYAVDDGRVLFVALAFAFCVYMLSFVMFLQERHWAGRGAVHMAMDKLKTSMALTVSYFGTTFKELRLTGLVDLDKCTGDQAQATVLDRMVLYFELCIWNLRCWCVTLP